MKRRTPGFDPCWTETRHGLTLYVIDSENHNGPRYFGGYAPTDAPIGNTDFGAYLQTSTRFATESQAIDFVIASANRYFARTGKA